MSHKPGSDKSKANDYQEQEEASYVSAMIVAADISKALLKKGYKMHPTSSGRHCCHDIYMKKRLLANPEIHHWALLDQELDWVGFNIALDAAVTSLTGNGSDWITIARKIEASLTTKGNDKQSLMYGIGYNKSVYADPNVSRSFAGKLAHKQIPSVSWFPQLAKLDPYDLLTLFPRPEATALLLMLGRAMVGVGGTVTQEGVIAHKMRSAAIIVGVEAGLGKSTLLTGIITAAKNLGYSSEPVSTAGSRFGWGKIAASDLAYKDDLTRDTQTAILRSETLKTIITGGAFSSERKGIDSETTKSNTTLFCCSNEYNVYDFYKMDEGSISRYNFLYTYNHTELDTLFPNYNARTDKNFERLAKIYNVTENTLFTYLLAHGVRLFCATLGIEIVNEAVIRTGADTTQETMENLREHFTYAPNVTHVKDLVSATAHLVALSIATLRQRNRVEACSRLKDLGFDYELLYCVLNQHAHSKGDEPYRLHGLSPACKASISKRLEDLSNRQGQKNARSAFETLTAELVSLQGATFPRSQGAYYSVWTESRKLVPNLAEGYAQMMEENESGNVEIEKDNLNAATRNNINTILELLKRNV